MESELVLAGVAMAPIIVALVELLKQAGLPSRYAPWANALMSLFTYGMIVLVDKGTIDVTLIGYLINALVIFLTAAGVYNQVLKPIITNAKKGDAGAD